MDFPPISRGRGRPSVVHDSSRPHQPHSRNRQWVAGEGTQQQQRSRSGTPSARPNSHNNGHHTAAGADNERWERGGGHGRGIRGSRGSRATRKFPNTSLRVTPTSVFSSPSNSAHSLSAFDDTSVDIHSAESYDGRGDHDGGEGSDNGDDEKDMADEIGLTLETDGFPEPDEPILETAEERENFYQSLVKNRELERKAAIATGKMDDPSVPKRLEDAISMVGTCQDMCPRFERYRRERENNLFEWEMIPGTKRVNHQRAVKMYERAAGDKTLPSDLRPPPVLKRTLDYLFHDLLPRGGFSPTFNFIRDRSRAVRNDFTMQHSYGSEAIECHDRCARFHILALHFERDRPGFSIALEEQQLMNTLQSLKEFYEDQRGRYEPPTELEMRVYHRLIHIRDQKERHESIPEHITSHPVFKLTTQFRLHVQRKSAPISKTSALVVDAEGMQIFGDLANVLRDQGNIVIIYLVACILERLFGKEAIDDIEAIRGDLDIPDIIDGVSFIQEDQNHEEMENEQEFVLVEDDSRANTTEPGSPHPIEPTHTSGNSLLSSSFPSSSVTTATTAFSQIVPTKPAVSAFTSLSVTPNVFNTPSPFGATTFPSSSVPILGVPAKSVFGQPLPVATQSVPPTATAPRASAFGPATTNSMSSSVAGSPSTIPPTPLNIPVFSPFSVQSNPSELTSTLGAIHQTLPSKPTPLHRGPEERNMLARNSMSDDATSSRGSATSALNPMAPVFLPTKPQHAPALLTSADVLPSADPFQKSPNPSPSPLPPKVEVPGPPTSAPPLVPFALSSSLPPSTKVSPPPSQQHQSITPQALPKINTNTFSNPFTSQHPSTPTIPPPLPKPQPISLPRTPSMSAPPINPLLNFRKASLGLLTTPTSNASQEILSPLFVSSPTATEHGMYPGLLPFAKSPRKGSSDQQPGTSPASLLFANGTSKGRTPPPSPIPLLPASVDEKELDRMSIRFVCKSLLVKSCFSLWRRRIQGRAAWIEACQQSEAYKLKLKQQREQQERHPHPTPGSEKKRRASILSNGYNMGMTRSSLNGESPLKKRARHRISSNFQRPLSDEDLARRFKENHKEHERWWAQGSFLEVIKHHVKPRLCTATNNHRAQDHLWHVWLSTNPYSDATAIWLERKLNVPASGDWVTEVVFSIPLALPSDPSVSNSPGLIIFECTSLQGVVDELERKYRILDDCARLRDIVDTFPPYRHFIPSLLLVSWVEDNMTQAASDFIDMVKKLVENQSITGYFMLPITSKTGDLDGKLANALSSLALDVEGTLVKSLNIRGVFKLFEFGFMSFISEWIENCTVHGQFEWQIFAQTFEVAIALMNTTAHSVSNLISEETNDVFPVFDSGHITDDDSTYTRVIDWLSTIGRSAENLAITMQTHRSIGREFPARELFDQLWYFLQLQIEQQLGKDQKASYYVPTAHISAAQEGQQAAYELYKAQLGKVLHMSLRRSPKRRSTSIDTDLTSSHSKRRRFSSPVESRLGDEEPTPLSSPFLNGRLTPSPTSTNLSLAPSEESPMVTVAMLRALTRDIRKKYAGSS